MGQNAVPNVLDRLKTALAGSAPPTVWPWLGYGCGKRRIRETNWLRQSVVYRDDAFLGPRLMGVRAMILAQAGEVNGALDEIEQLLAGPSWVSVHTLRLDPRWDPIRGHPPFQELLDTYSEQQ